MVDCVEENLRALKFIYSSLWHWQLVCHFIVWNDAQGFYPILTVNKNEIFFNSFYKTNEYHKFNEINVPDINNKKFVVS